jgi:hypothetical protein
MFRKTEDGSVLTNDDRVVFFSCTRFIADFVQGNCCFICGARPGTVPFNDEHILPDWILRKFRLRDKTITLPNGEQLRYSRFRIPCCEPCNSRMGREVEAHMSGLFAGGHAAFTQYLRDGNPWFLFGWMCLIFLKTHLKDNALYFHKDRRKGEQRIGELHAWQDLHHIHCMARSFYTQCELNAEVYGSLLVLPAKIIPGVESFDYDDLSFAQTMLLRIDDIAVIAVLDDSNALNSIRMSEQWKISGPLSPLQLREIAVRMAVQNLLLEERPVFSSELDLEREEYTIVAHRPPDIRFVGPTAENEELFGRMMQHHCGPMIPEGLEKAYIMEQMGAGHYTYLLDEQGEFRADHMDVINPDDSG